VTASPRLRRQPRARSGEVSDGIKGTADYVHGKGLKLGTIVGTQSGLCLDVAHGDQPSGNVNGAQIQLYTCNGGANRGAWAEKADAAPAPPGVSAASAAAAPAASPRGSPPCPYGA
jgi:hypothetical protein